MPYNLIKIPDNLARLLIELKKVVIRSKLFCANYEYVAIGRDDAKGFRGMTG